MRETAGRFAAWPGFATCISWLFAVWAALSVVGVFQLVLDLGLGLGEAHRGYTSDRFGDLAFVNVASLASSFLSALLVARGVLELHRGRRADAYRSFERALLVAIFVTQVFSFVESQFGAVFGLAIDLLLLLAVRSLRAGDRHDVVGAAQPCVDAVGGRRLTACRARCCCSRWPCWPGRSRPPRRPPRSATPTTSSSPTAWCSASTWAGIRSRASTSRATRARRPARTRTCC